LLKITSLNPPLPGIIFGMNRIWMILILLLGATAQAAEDVTADSLWSWLAWPNAPLVVDVRESSEWQTGHIGQSVLYAWTSGDLAQHWKDLPRGGSVVLVCQTGARAAKAAAFLESLRDSGYSTKVYLMTGGMNAWNHPVIGITNHKKAPEKHGLLDWDLLGRLRHGSSFASRLSL